MDIHDQAAALDRDGQFRFTPPTHALLAFRQALDELLEEGGVEGRHARYQENREIMGAVIVVVAVLSVVHAQPMA